MTRREILEATAGPAAVALAASALVVRSWLRWPDVLVDYGQQLYVAWRLAEGEVLYRDVAYFHGPLSSYVHAGVMRLWGTSLVSLVVFNLVVVAGLIVVLYKLLTELGSRFAATAACLVFVTIFAFSQYLRIGNYNYVCPYTSEITHGAALAVVAIYALARHLRNRTTTPLVVSGLALGLVFLTKAEVFLAAALGLGVALLAGGERRLGRLATLAATALVAPALAVALFCLAMPPAQAFESVTGAYSALVRAGSSELLFYRSRIGLDAPLVNLGRLLATSAWHFVVFAPALLAAWWYESDESDKSDKSDESDKSDKSDDRPRRWLLVVAGSPLAILAWNVDSGAWLQAARPLPLFMAILIGACLAALVGERRGRASVFGGSAAGVLALSVFALALLAKIIINSRVYHYGFVLAMPATLLLVVAWVEWIPAWLEARGRRGAVFRGFAMCVLVVAMAAHLLVTDRRFREKRYLVADAGDAFWTDPRGRAVDAVLEYFNRVDAAEPTLVVVPDGIMLNYLARAPSTVPYLNYVPTEVFAFGEQEILAALAASPPDYVAVVDKSTAEFGYRYFGRDYARDILRWIEGAYESVGVIGAEPLTGRGFGIELMRRTTRAEAME